MATTFVVDRARWANATVKMQMNGPFAYGNPWISRINTSLFDPTTGFQCCLGFVSEQLGVSRTFLSGVGSPESIGIDEEKLRGVLLDEYGHHTELARRAMIINDSQADSYKTAAEKEAALIDLFKEHGFAIEFTGEAPAGVIDLTTGK